MKKTILFILFICGIGIAQTTSIKGMFEFESNKTPIISQDFNSNNTLDWENKAWFRDTLDVSTELGFDNAEDGSWITIEIWTESTEVELTFASTITWMGASPNTYLTTGINWFQIAKSGSNYLGIVCQ